MKRTIGLILASGLVLLLAGCSAGSSGTTATSGTAMSSATMAKIPVSKEPVRNFDLAVKCPGVYYEKTHGWSDAQIEQQEALDEEDIPVCVKYVEAQPKGYVPPPPPGYVPKKAPAKAMPMLPSAKTETSPKAGTAAH